MANDQLRRAMLERDVDEQTIADTLQVDPKTVGRWIEGRTPRPRSRIKLAALLQADEGHLWPETLQDDEPEPPKRESEIVKVYPHRRSMQHREWRRFFGSATTEIGLLVHSGMWLAEDPGIRDALRQRGHAGARVRILLGDPDTPEIQDDDRHRGLPGANGIRVQQAVRLMQPLADAPGVELRLHSTVLYNAIFRSDDQLLVNPRIYGARATLAPVMHLRHVPGRSLTSTYIDSFEQIWSGARHP